MRYMTGIGILSAVMAGGCESQPRVVRDHSVAAQFSEFNGKSGFSVSSAQTARPKAKDRPSKGQPVPVANNNNFLGDVHWTTNLKLDQPAPDHPPASPVTGPGSIPGMGNVTPDGGGLVPTQSPAMMGPAGPSTPPGFSVPGSSSPGVVPAR